MYRCVSVCCITAKKKKTFGTSTLTKSNNCLKIRPEFAFIPFCFFSRQAWCTNQVRGIKANSVLPLRSKKSPALISSYDPNRLKAAGVRMTLVKHMPHAQSSEKSALQKQTNKSFRSAIKKESFPLSTYLGFQILRSLGLMCYCCVLRRTWRYVRYRSPDSCRPWLAIAHTYQLTAAITPISLISVHTRGACAVDLPLGRVWPFILPPPAPPRFVSREDETGNRDETRWCFFCPL